MSESALPPTEPGQWVRHPGQPEWGLGQVQSVIGERVTVNFEHAGKRLVNARVVALQVVEEPDA
jgi:FKBP-type peptidyl-prolyl cis-trans isomerase 2